MNVDVDSNSSECYFLASLHTVPSPRKGRYDLAAAMEMDRPLMPFLSFLCVHVLIASFFLHQVILSLFSLSFCLFYSTLFKTLTHSSQPSSPYWSPRQPV
ncbi:hypothetical protein K457DRAFT_384469 [Linnemannia elongata AG-77]|uniref:Uncharacterized protein n=1 Tax=Linnemannia elongata AG-77 TaxID=1314771 RepID=A0A197KJ55_9FUNG|nr:hypothetical protein K457DRAFT_384469 [Linnemannia elongata AG-77]